MPVYSRKVTGVDIDNNKKTRGDCPICAGKGEVDAEGAAGFYYAKCPCCKGSGLFTECDGTHRHQADVGEYKHKPLY